MIILGFHNGFDAGAALLVDGRLVGAVNEERFNRIKLYAGFPKQSIDYLLNISAITLDDIDIFAYGWFEGNNCKDVMLGLIRRAMHSDNSSLAEEIILDRLQSEYANDTLVRDQALEECRQLGISSEKLFFCEHHKSHAWSAFAPSPFDKALIVTADGRGDYKSLTVSIGDPNGVTEVDWLSPYYS